MSPHARLTNEGEKDLYDTMRALEYRQLECEDCGIEVWAAPGEEQVTCDDHRGPYSEGS